MSNIDNIVNNAKSMNQLVKSAISNNKQYGDESSTFTYDETLFNNYDFLNKEVYQDIENKTSDLQRRYGNDTAEPAFTPKLNLEIENFNRVFNDEIARKMAIVNGGAYKDAVDFANNAGHDCALAPGKNEFDRDNSKDKWTVNRLREYANSDNNGSLDTELNNVNSFVNSIDGAKWRSTQDDINGKISQISKNNANINKNITDANNKYNDIKKFKSNIDSLSKSAYNLIITEQKNINDINSAIDADYKIYLDIMKDYQNKIDLLQQDFNKLGPVKSRLNEVLIDNKNNKQQVDKYNRFALNHINASEGHLYYLKNKKQVNKDISLQNYEELYKSVILQNDILENTLRSTQDELVKKNRDADYQSIKVNVINTIKLYLYIGYYVLILFLILFFIFYEKSLSYYTIFGILITAAIYPFIMIYIELSMINIWNYLLSIMTGSVFEYTPLR